MIDASMPVPAEACRYPLGFVSEQPLTDTRRSLIVPLTLLDVVFWLPTATLPNYEDALYAVVGAAAVTGLSLDQIAADSAYFCVNTLADSEHRACLTDTLARFAVATTAKNNPLGVFA